MPIDPPPSAEDKRRREAEAVLNRLTHDNGSFGSVQSVWRQEPPSDDAAERWGRRAGRALWGVALIAVLYLLVRMLSAA